MSCKHTLGMAFIPQPFRCEVCTEEERKRHESALRKIVNRIRESEMTDLAELLKDIFEIACKALKA